MPGSGTSSFTDPDDYEAGLRWAQMNLLVTSRDFRARLTWAELHCVRLLRSQEDLPRIAYVSLEPALVFVTFPTTVDPPPVWRGVEVQSGTIMFHSRGERLHQWMRGPCVWSLMALLPKDLQDYCRALSGKPFFCHPQASYCGPDRAMPHACSACIYKPAASLRRSPISWRTPRLPALLNRV